MTMPLWNFALSVGRNNSPDRDLIEGVALFSESYPNCRFQLIPPEKLYYELRLNRLDGVICRLIDKKTIRYINRQNIPTVDLLHDSHHSGVSVVSPDNQAVGRMAAEHFLERGFKNFAFFGYRHVPYSDERRDGFLSCLAKNCYTATIYETSTNPWIKFGYASLPGYSNRTKSDKNVLAKNLLAAPKPLAAFCCHDPRAADLLESCWQSGLSIPNDVAILGVDDDSVYCSFSFPKLSSIDLDAKAIGYEAAQLLNDMKNGMPPAKIQIPPRQVSVRGSSEIYPVKPTWISDALVFIKRNATSGISALDVFNHLGLSHTLIQSTFRKIRHTSIQKEIIAERMSTACKLLQTTTLPISRVASSSGFASPRYFCQAFTHLYGTSPSEWRILNTSSQGGIKSVRHEW